MQYTIMDLPVLDNNILTIEKKYCEVLNQYRNGKILEPEVLDWMDAANNHLIVMKD